MPFTAELMPFLTNVFVETGTYQGDTVHSVATYNTSKPSIIHSLELSSVFYNNCINRFKHNDRITIHHANSKNDLSNVIDNIQESICFWLDSHWSGVPNVGCDPETRCPVLFELEQIRKHPIKTHTIMIDDIRLMDNEHFPVTKAHIVDKLMEINSNYTLKYFDDYCSKEDILVAYISK